MVIEYFRRKQSEMPAQVMWVESICEDEEVIEVRAFAPRARSATYADVMLIYIAPPMQKNITQNKVNSPDYTDLQPDQAIEGSALLVRVCCVAAV